MTKYKKIHVLTDVNVKEIQNKLNDKINNMKLKDDLKIVLYLSILTNLYINFITVLKQNQRNDCIELAKKIIESNYEISE